MANLGAPVQQLFALYAQGRFADMESLARSLPAGPAPSPIVNELLGMALCGQRRFAEALQPLQTSVRLAPADAQFWENLGLCQRELGQFSEAERSLRESLALRPQSTETLNSLGSTLRSLSRHDEAEAALRRALALDPRHPAAHFNLGNVLSDMGRFAEGEAVFRNANAIEPGNFRPLANLAVLLCETGRYVEAESAARAALERIGPIQSASPDGSKIAADVAAGVLARVGKVGEAAQIFRATEGYRMSAGRFLDAYSAARRACDWDLTALMEAQARQSGADFWNSEPGSPFAMLMMTGATPAAQLTVSSRHAQLYAATPPVARKSRSGAARRLRIGYVSGDFRNHPVGALMVRVFELHDRDRFEAFGYDYSPPDSSPLRHRIERAFEHFVPIRDLSFRDAARRMAEDDCDVIVDIAGWTAGTRSPILAARPAPIQVQWLGFPGTMGAPWIDYVVADPVVVRSGEETEFSEKIIRLPLTYWSTDDLSTIGPVPTRAALGLPDEGFVFCSFNQSYKITPEVFDRWMRLLAEVEGSVLWLLDLNPDATRALRARAAASGVGSDRIIFAPWADSATHLARIGQADLALDCQPYGSHTTASDVLWAGVPLVALAGRTFVSRVSASILAAAGLSDLITTSLQDYHALALRLAKDRTALARMKSRAAASRGSAMFDTAAFTRHLEAAYTIVVERHRSGQSPDHTAVAAATADK